MEAGASWSAVAKNNYIVAVVNAPSDRPQGMNAIFRMSDAHAGDIGAMARYLKDEAAVPVWLIGSGMGTFSAALGAIAGGKDIDGLVLTSAVTRSPPEWAIAKSHPNGVADMALSEITVPTLIMSRREDGGNDTPAADAAMLRTRLTSTHKVEIALLGGGDPPSHPTPRRYRLTVTLVWRPRPLIPSPISSAATNDRMMVLCTTTRRLSGHSGPYVRANVPRISPSDGALRRTAGSCRLRL
jgi:hypothetical protein